MPRTLNEIRAELRAMLLELRRRYPGRAVTLAPFWRT